MMTDVTKLPFAIFQPETALETMQRGFSGYSGAWVQITRCLMSAAVAEVELMRSIYLEPSNDSARPTDAGNPRETAREWLRAGQTRYDAIMKGHRQINDNLTAGLFAATHGLVDHLGSIQLEEPASSRPQPLSQASVSRPSSPSQQAAE